MSDGVLITLAVACGLAWAASLAWTLRAKRERRFDVLQARFALTYLFLAASFAANYSSQQPGVLRAVVGTGAVLAALCCVATFLGAPYWIVRKRIITRERTEDQRRTMTPP